MLSFVFIFVVFIINNVLHLISEKIIIVIFLIFVYAMMVFLKTAVQSEYEKNIQLILNDVKNYANSSFDFLFLTRLFFVNLKNFINYNLNVTSNVVNKIKNQLNYQI